MIAYEDALNAVCRAAWTLPVERILLTDCLNRVLARPARSDIDMPPFNKSSMDGYACRSADAFSPLRVLERVAAGKVPTHPIVPGSCTKVMTGAPVPEGADCVLIVEEVEENPDGTIRFTGTAPKSNICAAGEDIRAGDTVLTGGTRIRAQHLPVLASVGHGTVEVHRRPRVGVMATGDELVPPAAVPGPGQIRNSNSIQLVALATEAGADAFDLGIVPDNDAIMRAAWETALENHDIVVSTGGVSMGDFDLVPDILQHHGFAVHFDRVAIQPGKPVLFGTRSDKACFGLSGNPVSSFLQFLLFVAPFLARLQGAEPRPLVVPLTLGEDFTRRNAGRMGLVPIRLDEHGQVRSVPFHGSAHINAFTAADGVLAFPADATSLSRGSVVDIRLLGA